MDINFPGTRNFSWYVKARGVFPNSNEGNQIEECSPLTIWAAIESSAGIALCFISASKNDYSFSISPLLPLFYCSNFIEFDGNVKIEVGIGPERLTLDLLDFWNPLSDLKFSRFSFRFISEENSVPAISVISGEEGGKEPKSSSTILTVYSGFNSPLRPIVREDFIQKGRTLVFAHGRGGGEFKLDLNGASSSSMAKEGLKDLVSIIHYINKFISGPLYLSGSSHGGLLCLLAAIYNPDLIEKISIVSPIVSLSSYLRSEYGKLFSNFYSDGFWELNPIEVLSNHREITLPSLQIFAPIHDVNLGVQPYGDFISLWKSKGGEAEFYLHEGDHFSPPECEVKRFSAIQNNFLTPRGMS